MGRNKPTWSRGVIICLLLALEGATINPIIKLELLAVDPLVVVFKLFFKRSPRSFGEDDSPF